MIIYVCEIVYVYRKKMERYHPRLAIMYKRCGKSYPPAASRSIGYKMKYLQQICPVNRHWTYLIRTINNNNTELYLRSASVNLQHVWRTRPKNEYLTTPQRCKSTYDKQTDFEPNRLFSHKRRTWWVYGWYVSPDDRTGRRTRNYIQIYSAARTTTVNF